MFSAHGHAFVFIFIPTELCPALLTRTAGEARAHECLRGVWGIKSQHVEIDVGDAERPVAEIDYRTLLMKATTIIDVEPNANDTSTSSIGVSKKEREKCAR